jgi:DNA-binding NarL/FixJ family response regulator
MEPDPIRVSIVEDNAEELALYVSIVDAAPGLACASAHPDGAHALRHLPHVRPHVVLMDVELPDLSGIACVRQLKTAVPEILAVMLTKHQNDDYLFESLQAGAVGYLIKAHVREKLPGLIRQVLREEVVFTPEIARRVLVYFRQHERKLQDVAQLTAREEEVLRLVAKGFTSKEIGERLGCAANTVDRHAQHICEKLHVSGRVAAADRYFGGLGGA